MVSSFWFGHKDFIYLHKTTFSPVALYWYEKCISHYEVGVTEKELLTR